MSARIERRPPEIIIVDRNELADRVEAVARELGTPVMIRRFGSVLEVLGDGGPRGGAGLLCSVAATGPFLGDLLKWTDRDPSSRIPAAVVGGSSDEASVEVVLGRDHARWIDAQRLGEGLAEWLPVAVEVQDLRGFREQHDRLAQALREERSKLFGGELERVVPEEGPPCGPPLPTSVEEIKSLKEARAQFERGLIRAAVRETGSLKDASAALGISYTSLWRRMR